MTQFNLIKSISITNVAMLILGMFLKELQYSIWSYVCYVVVIVGCVFILSIRHRAAWDEKIKRPQLIMLAGALLFTVALVIFQYYQVFK